ncbi:MAG: ABC transporter permease [Albidovulum sp.]|nr:ABC transporter permease [Albidovulum sp.]
MTLLLQRGFIGAVLVFLVAPLFVVTGVSVNRPKRLLFPPDGFSLKWYIELFVQNEWANALTNSVIIAMLAGLLAVAVALPLALFIWSRGGLLARALFGLGIAPFMLPPVVSALGFLVFWISVGLYGNILATIVSHAIFLTALPLVAISLGLEEVERPLIEAARTMGADRRTVFRTVVFPLIRPYVISGFVFAVVLSLNEYIIAYMVAGFTAETLPIRIFNSLRYGYTPIMAAVAVLFVLTAAVVFGAVAFLGDLPRLFGAHRSEEP